MNAGPHLESDVADAAQDRLCAADGTRGSVERGEEAIAGGVALLTSETPELSSDKRIVLGE
jgi:hypothetical protein